MTVCLTGGTGFIGAHIARALVEERAGEGGGEVRCLVRAGSRVENLAGLAVERVVGDLTDPGSLRRAFAGCEVVYHCAADYRLYARDPAELHRHNVEGTRNVLAAAAEVGAGRVVYTSSVGALASSADGAVRDESDRPALDEVIGHYKRSKYLAEREAEDWAARGLPVVIVSPSTPVGELDIKPTPTGQILVDFLNGRLPAYVDTGLNVIDVRDVAAGHLLAARRGRPGERYILGHRNLTLAQLLGLLAQLTGLPAPRWRLPHWLPLAIAHLEAPVARWRGREPRVPLDGARMARNKMFFDAAKARRELGLPQSSIEAALRRAVAYFVERGLARRPAKGGA